VAISGDTVVVGAPHWPILGYRNGAAYVFVKPGDGWGTMTTMTETVKLTASDEAWEGEDWTGNGFGASVAISGDTIVVGAYGHNISLQPDQGAAYIFSKPTLTVNKAGSGSGTVTSTPDSIHCGATCAASLDAYSGLSLSATPDPVAFVAVGPPNDGILRLASAGAFAVATVNLGVSGLMTVTADTGALPVTIAVCETHPQTGQCLAPPSPSVQTQIEAGATPTFGIFVHADTPIPFDPATNRIQVHLAGGGGGGGTSVAVCTAPLCP
jgi:hypothetical protein